MTRFGVRWYDGHGEHDYKQSGFSEYETMLQLFAGLMARVADDQQLFDALSDGRQDTIYWVTDGFGFALYRV